MEKEVLQDFHAQEIRISPARISLLKSDEIFVFGSNLQGMHGGGAARIAVTKFGAIMGQGVGLQGQSYEFIGFAKLHPEYKFLVTRVGCGIAGFTDGEIAPLFSEAINVANIYLPQEFLNELYSKNRKI